MSRRKEEWEAEVPILTEEQEKAVQEILKKLGKEPAKESDVLESPVHLPKLRF